MGVNGLEKLELPSYAKVNLTLDVLEKRKEDGYHYIRTVMVPISLADRVVLTHAPELTLSCSPAVTGKPEENLAYRAAALMRQATGYSRGASILIHKAIPVAGGLAGGSTNAAAVLVGLNRLWGAGLSEADLVSLAIRLGSDVPFFIPGKPARVEGIGERLTPLPVDCRLWMVVATPDVAKSTGGVYGLFDQLTEVVRPDTAAMENALLTGDLAGVALAFGNVFEQVMLPRHPEIGQLKQAMLEGGALGAVMSGAGPTVLGLVADEQSGRSLLERVRPLSRQAAVVQVVHA